jgi:hypothetical protein
MFNKTQWRNLPVDVAVPVGRRLPLRALNWLKGFAAHGPPEFQAHIAHRLTAKQALW